MFLPLAMDSLGVWHKSAIAEVRKLGSSLARHTLAEQMIRKKGWGGDRFAPIRYTCDDIYFQLLNVNLTLLKMIFNIISILKLLLLKKGSLPQAFEGPPLAQAHNSAGSQCSFLKLNVKQGPKFVS